MKPKPTSKLLNLFRKNLLCASFMIGIAVLFSGPAVAAESAPVASSEQSNIIFQRVRTQYIAALGDPDATSGVGAEGWGLWRKDPGPRGVWLANYHHLKAAGGFGPGNWRFDERDWWLDENGLIMEQPDFPILSGKYIVTGGRETMSVLTIHPVDENGEQHWELDGDASLYDVTHLACRSARYTPMTDSASCTPEGANKTDFPVEPGGLMPAVNSCEKKDYTVLLVVAVGVEAS